MAALAQLGLSSTACRTTNGSDVTWVAILHAVAGPAAFADTEAALDRQWFLHDQVPDAIRTHTAIAVAEIIANTMEHGSTGLHRVQIDMHISVEPGRVLIALIDDGNECRVDLNSVPMPGCDAERGRGLAIVQSALHRLVYTRTAGANHWLLISKPF